MTQAYVATVPSNIALIKYWGKRPSARQWPCNDSLSMTLNKLHSQTTARVSQAPQHSFRFEEQLYSPSDPRMAKAFAQLDRLAGLYKFTAALAIESFNTFPTGAGIASSASGLAALTLASIMAWTGAKNWDELEQAGFSRFLLADLARQGSGSACRSIFGGFVLWEAGLSPTAQRYEVIASAAHWPLRDTVVLFSTEHKATGSSEAHQLAPSSPLFQPRISGLPERLQRIRTAIEARDMQELGAWIEVEALEMHAVIMTASPAIHYLSEAALSFLSELRLARQNSEIKAWFTIDAGPNIHLIHEHHEHERLCAWLQKHLPEQRLLHDELGTGPRLSLQREL